MPIIKQFMRFLSGHFGINRQRWLVCLTGALFFFYAGILMNMYNAFSTEIMTDLTINATQLGLLSASYLYANVIFLIPAGILLDRVSIKLILRIAMGLAILLTILLGLIHRYWEGVIITFLLGFSASVCFLGSLKLVKNWFPIHKTALITGVIISMAMLGGIVANYPLIWLTLHIGWRLSLICLAILGVAFLLLKCLYLSDSPSGSKPKEGEVTSHQLKNSLKNSSTWLIGFYNAFMNLPLALLGAEWGRLYLTQSKQVSTLQAATTVMMLFVGMIIGSSSLGWLADRSAKKYFLLIISAVLSLMTIVFLIFGSNFEPIMLMFLFCLLGVLSGAQTIGYALATQLVRGSNLGLSLSIVSMLVMAGGAVLQPIFGMILDANWKEEMRGMIPFYSSIAFQYSMSLLIIGFAACIVISLLLYKKHKDDKALKNH